MLGRHGRPQLVLLEGHRGQSLAVAGVISLDVLGEVALVPETFQAARQQAPERFLACKVKKNQIGALSITSKCSSIPAKLIALFRKSNEIVKHFSLKKCIFGYLVTIRINTCMLPLV